MNFNSESLDLFDSEGEPNSSPELEAAKQGAELTKLLLRLKTPNAATIEALLGLTEEIYASAPESLESSLASLGRDLPAFPWLQSFMLEKAGNISGALAALDSFTAPSIGLDNELESFRLYSLARLSAALERWNKAISSLASSIRLTERFRALTRSFALLRSIEQSTEISYKRKYRVALVGNSTLDFILPAIKSYAFAAGIEVALYAGRYDQHCQELLDRSSALSAFEPDIIIIATNWRSLCLTEEHNDHGSIARDKTSEVTGLWDVCRDR